MKTSLAILALVILVTFAACDQKVGEDGVIQDSITGERIEGVTIKLRSNAGNKTTVSDQAGYFNTKLNFSCGISSCEDAYTMTFEKEGYENLTTNERYYFKKETSFVTPGKKDTLMFKLVPLVAD